MAGSMAHKLAVTLLLVCSAAAGAGQATCSKAACQAETLLLALRQEVSRGRHLGPALEAPIPSVRCPGEGNQCSGDRCCPGTATSGGKTFPCANARNNFDRCQGGQEELVEAWLAEITRVQKYSFVRGSGWKNGTWETLPGYYTGDAGATSPYSEATALYDTYGIPSMNMEDNGQGFRTVNERTIPQVTGWPVALAAASSWSETDTYRWAEALATEFRAKGANVILGPGVNVHRVARGGRNAEYSSGESGYFGARIVKPYIEGLQKNRVLCVVKHFVTNSQETNRDTVDSRIDERTLWEVYYPPFDAAVQAGVAAAMCSYNLVNGIHACGNPHTVKEDLKGTMGFDGFVQSDWWALHSFAARDGVDQEMPGDSTPYQPAWYTDENLDTLTVDELNQMVRPMLTQMLRWGLMEPQDPSCQFDKGNGCNASLYDAVATTPEHQALNKELATKCVILLKNDDAVLPLTDLSSKKIAVLGSACNAPQNVSAQLADWQAGSYYNIGGSGRVIAHDPVTIYAALKAMCAEKGCELRAELTDDADKAIAKAEDADVALICSGGTTSEGKDRETLSLDQEDFMVAVSEGTETPTVSLTMAPGAIVMPWIGKVEAALNVFVAGTHTGDAFVATLIGENNPAAKLLVTFPLSADQTIPPCEEIECPYDEKLFAGFPHYADKEVAFSFGHGLSYTTFKYTDLKTNLPSDEAMPNGCDSEAVVCHSIQITNTGNRKGVEVAQLYMGFPEGNDEPDKLLRGFVRTDELKPQEAVTAYFPLYERDLQIWSPKAKQWSTPDGMFKFHVGTSSRSLSLETALLMSDGKPSLNLKDDDGSADGGSDIA